MTILTCFACTLWWFHAFSGTNLLTRCHSASSCFLLFLVPERLFGQYSRNWTKSTPNLLFFPEGSRTPKKSRRRARGAHTIGPHGPDPGHAGLGWGHPVDPPAPPLRLYNPFRPKNTVPIDETPERLQGRRHRRETPIRGTELCPGTLPGRGSAPGSHLHQRHRLHHAPWVVPPWTTGSSCS